MDEYAQNRLANLSQNEHFVNELMENKNSPRASVLFVWAHAMLAA